MVLDAPVTIHGSVLKAAREGYGVEVQELAAKLGHHRNTITAWEKHPALTVKQQRLYRAALRELTKGE